MMTFLELSANTRAKRTNRVAADGNKNSCQLCFRLKPAVIMVKMDYRIFPPLGKDPNSLNPTFKDNETTPHICHDAQTNEYIKSEAIPSVLIRETRQKLFFAKGITEPKCM